MASETTPQLLQTVLDTEDPRTLAEFYRRLLGLAYRPGDEPPTDGPDERGQDWLVLTDPSGARRLAFQKVEQLPRPTWPDGPHPQMLHLDTTVRDTAALAAVRRRALELGATELYDRSDDPDEPLHVLADPAGHPFCVFVG